MNSLEKYINYKKYLASDKWARKRKQKAIEQNYRCEVCDKVVPKGFHIHHKTYEHFGDEPLNDLMFLCEECHTNIHLNIQVKKNENKTKKFKRACINCLYSQLLHRGKQVNLYCNIKFDICEKDYICTRYKKGAEKDETEIKVKHLKSKKNKHKKRV